MPSPEQEKRRLRIEERERWIMIAIAIGFISLIPSAVLGVLLYREIDSRSTQNRELIAKQAVLVRKVQANEGRQEKIRAEAREAVRQADIENCHDLEVVKGNLRSIVAFDPEELRKTLEQLGIDPDSKRGQDLAARSREAADEAVRTLSPRDCSKLPDPTVPTNP
jgi:flagellar biosynthesis/type III secretory pathway M-ring protein FliF/YscJ